MALRCYNILSKDLNIILKPFVRHKSQRRNLGKPPGVARSLETRLKEMNYKDPKIHFKVDIGFSQPKKIRREVLQEHIAAFKENRSNQELERLARKNELIVPLDEVREEWAKTIGPQQIKASAEHHSVYEHLYGDAYFLPIVKLDVKYEKHDNLIPVFRGNHLKPENVGKSPIVNFESADDSLWTLVMTTPDGHFSSENSEYVHWLVGNIKGNDLSSGEVVHNYMQPFPAKGAGYYRYIFVLYKQSKPLDFSSLKNESDRIDLDKRTFKTYDFYRDREDVITPAGLAFFQADWDSSVTEFFHGVLGTEEPVFCYDFPEKYHPKQKWFPIRMPFNLYLDRYRDKKEIAKEFLVRKLKKVHPFKGIEPPLEYPNAVAFKKGTPSWLKLEIRKERLGWGRVNEN